MTLYLIGIGYKKEHINFEQKKIIEKCEKVFLEFYTSFYEDSFSDLEKFLDKKVEVLLREDIESKIEEKVLEKSKTKNICLLVLGDPLIATTHSDLLLRCEHLKIDYKIYSNISIGNLICHTGLNFYKFGKITSIPFFTKSYMPRTPYLYFLDNYKSMAHTLFLLDLKPNTNNYLSIKDSLKYLLDIQKIISENEELKKDEVGLIDENTKIITLSRLGFNDGKIIYSSLKNLIKYDEKNNLQPPLCFIIPNYLNEIEEMYLEKFRIKDE